MRTRSSGCPECALRTRRLGVLIHEATFEAEKQSEAIVKQHSTITEALDMGRRTNATCTMLHHFSQRYPKVPKLGGAGGGSATGKDGAAADARRLVGASFDLLYLRGGGYADYEALQTALPQFEALLAEYESWEEGGSLTRRLRLMG
jgi:hypothetical protein